MMVDKNKEEDTKKPDRSDYFRAVPDDFVFHSKKEE